MLSPQVQQAGIVSSLNTKAAAFVPPLLTQARQLHHLMRACKYWSGSWCSRLRKAYNACLSWVAAYTEPGQQLMASDTHWQGPLAAIPEGDEAGSEGSMPDMPETPPCTPASQVFAATGSRLNPLAPAYVPQCSTQVCTLPV